MTITEAAEELGVSRIRLVNWCNRGYIGESKGGRGYPRTLSQLDLRAARIAAALTNANHRLLAKIGRERLYEWAEKDANWLFVNSRYGRLEVLIGFGNGPAEALRIK